MAISLRERFKHAWNVFKNRDPTDCHYRDIGINSYYRQDRVPMLRGGERTIISSIYTRIATDAAAVHIVHAKLDNNGRFIDTIDSGLNNCLTVEANIDQSGRAFVQDAVLTMLDVGVIALVPVDTEDDPDDSGSFEIFTMRVGRIVEWYPEHIKVNVYNDRTGLREDVLVPKRMAAVIENPFYPVMNDQNSTMQRLIRKLSLLDAVDEENSSAKMNLIIQLPYAVKTELQKKQAAERRDTIEKQLNSSKYGIAYSDATEKIVQLNRPLENNLLDQIKYLTETVLSQLGLDVSILNCTADEVTMLRYYDSIVEPIVAALCDGMKRTFLTKNARTRRQSVIYYRDPFKLVPVSQLANLANAFTRNEIMTSNEIRQVIGMKPSDEPAADELRNKNLYPEEGAEGAASTEGITESLYSGLPQPGTPEWTAMVEAMDENDYKKFMQNADEIDEMLEGLESELNSDEIKHYGVGQTSYDASDPTSKYNHEYYEAHKELQKRRSTSGLNEAGKEEAWLTKERLKDERKAVVEKHAEERDQKIKLNNEEKKNLLYDQQEYTKSRIQQLRDFLKQCSPERKKLERDSIQAEIDRMREQNKQQKDAIREDFKGRNTTLREEHRTFAKETKEKYEQMYIDALESIKANPAFQKYKYDVPKKSSSSSSSSSSSQAAKPKSSGPSKFETDLATVQSVSKKKKK